MPNNWLLVDTNFPTVTEDMPVKEQIAKIIDYMAILTEMLQYQLQNLDASNWNAGALQDISDSAAEAVAGQIGTLTNQVNALKSTVDSLSARVSGMDNLSGRVQEAEEAISYLEQDAAEATERLDALEESVTEAQVAIDALEQGQLDMEEQVSGEGGIAQRLTEVEKVADVVTVTEDGASIGGENKKIYLVGEIYINGVRME